MRLVFVVIVVMVVVSTVAMIMTVTMAIAMAVTAAVTVTMTMIVTVTMAVAMSMTVIMFGNQVRIVQPELGDSVPCDTPQGTNSTKSVPEVILHVGREGEK